MSCLRAVTAVFLGFVAGPALADLTPEDVWQSWQDQLSQYGYEITGTPRSSERGIVIPDLGLTQDLPDDGGLIEIRIGRIGFDAAGAGTVAVVYPPKMPMAIAVTPKADKPVTAVVTLSHDDLSITASGTPDAIGYTYAARAVSIEIGDVSIGGAPVENVAGSLGVEDLVGHGSTRIGGGLLRVMQSLSSGPVSYVFHSVDSETGSVFDIAGSAGTMTYETRLDAPEADDLSDMAAAMEKGFRAEADIGFTAGESRFDVTDGKDKITGKSRSERAMFGVSLSEDGLRYESESRAMRVTAETGMFPMPLTYSVDRAASRLRLPVAPDDAVQDFALSLNFDGLTFPEALWALIDPEARLPRDPAKLALDLSGKARLTANIFDQAQMSALSARGEAPGDLESVTLDKLTVSVAGAKLTGAGAITLDKAKRNEAPPAEGVVDLRLDGGDGLLDKLVGLGVVTEDQAMTARMMASMFGNAVEGEDALTSRIEIAKDGAVTVNGQRMR